MTPRLVLALALGTGLSTTPLLAQEAAEVEGVDSTSPLESESSESQDGTDLTNEADDNSIEGGIGPVGNGCTSRTWNGDWSDKTAEIAQTKAKEIAALEAYSFPELTGEQEANREGIRTEGLVVIQGGQLLYERYDRGFEADDAHLTWSVSKTFTNALTAIAVKDGLLQIDDSICKYLPATNPENCVVSIKDLLTFGSGFEWKESYENEPPTTSSVVSMLYGDGIDDMAAFVSSAKRNSAPGEAWQYSSGDTTLLAAVLGVALTPKYGRDFPWTSLFEPLGMEGIVWERDTAGTIVGSSYLYGPPRELAKFGLLWLDDGCWEGERIFPEGWVAQSTQVSEPIQKLARDWGGGVQGWQVWLNQPLYAQGQEPSTAPWPDVSYDTYTASGHWRQMISVFPAYDAVVIRVGDDRDGSFKRNTFFPLALALTEGAELLPPPAPKAENTVAGRSEIADPLSFDTGLLSIATNYGAKLACSCAYVMEQDDDYCRTWVKANPNIVKIKFDREAKTVKAKALGLSRSTARWVSERDGCVLE